VGRVDVNRLARLFRTVTLLSATDSRLAAEVYHHATTHFGKERLNRWRDGATDIDDALGVDVDGRIEMARSVAPYRLSSSTQHPPVPLYCGPARTRDG
jgi:O-methyltransferase involved in polyketide biosynthesis